MGLEIPEPQILLADEIKSMRSALGGGIAEGDIIRALDFAGNNSDRAMNILLDDPSISRLLMATNVPHETLEEIPAPGILLANEINSVRSVLGDEIAEDDIIRALDVAGNNSNRAMSILLDASSNSTPLLEAAVPHEPQYYRKPSELVSKSLKQESCPKELHDSHNVIKKEEPEMVDCVKREELGMVDGVKLERPEIVDDDVKSDERKRDSPKFPIIVIDDGIFKVKKEEAPMDLDQDESLAEMMNPLTTTHFSPNLHARPIRAILPMPVTDRKIQVFSMPDPVDTAEFPEEPDWFLVGRSYVMGLSTTRGKGKLEANEIVYFSFPKNDERKFYGRRKWVSAKAAAATSEIVRFSTKRSGELGRLPPEWSRCLIPLVNSSKVFLRLTFNSKILSFSSLHTILDASLRSFYIHNSIFYVGDKSSWKLEAASSWTTGLHPLHNLFTLLKIKPFKQADFTPEELDSRKRSLDLTDNGEVVGLAKRRKGDETYIDQSSDDQAISEAALNKLVGADEVYNLKEAEPPSTLVPKLHPYQKQALYWMSELEKGFNVEQAARTLHPCWSAYKIFDKRSPTVYVNVFSGEATTQFPSATQMTRGGILADAMGLGKTVMTIALILSNPSRRPYNDRDMDTETWEGSGRRLNRANSVVTGGTLIVCPMALLGQWKDELAAHSKSGSISVFVHYGGEKSNNPAEISKHDVVLTTYGVLSSAYKSKESSIFYTITWLRVVLDEAHIIKDCKSKGAQSTFALNSHSRWCLTATPLQNKLEDLYSLLCFLRVQPWCDWSWWHKLIEIPYENGDERGLRLVKAILRPLMLRRTKESKDKQGNPILVLPPAHVQVVECKQSKEERDFYEALFWKSKMRFDKFVAEERVNHNYASILELLLRLRQCCNHPFLVMNRGEGNQKYADLNTLAKRFLEGSETQSSAPARAYVEEVVEGIKKGEFSECPICLESASDDPVFTPCAHRMCRECLLESWKTPTSGECPICRRPLKKEDLIAFPSESPFKVDLNENWKESSKIRELIYCLEKIKWLGTGEKSIVFSQWTSFLDLLEICFRRRGIEFLRFDGQLSQKSREKVLKEFSESSYKKVMLMSLKAGGVGLNLTAASNVFLLDPWWNPAVEEQAIMRIHRIGQKRQVQVRRFIVKDTVEDRMQQLQANKQRMIAGALTDEEIRTARIEELKMLFR